MEGFNIGIGVRLKYSFPSRLKMNPYLDLTHRITTLNREKIIANINGSTSEYLNYNASDGHGNEIELKSENDRNEKQHKVEKSYWNF